MLPSNGSLTRRPLPSPGSHRDRFPRFAGTMRRSDFRAPVPHRLVTRCGYQPLRLCSFPWSRRAIRGLELWVWQPRAMVRLETADLSCFWGVLSCSCRALRPRQDRGHQAIRNVPDAAPVVPTTKAPATTWYFEAPSHGFGTRCLRFARKVALQDARLASAVSHTLRSGTFTRRTPTKGFSHASYIASPFPRLNMTQWHAHAVPCRNSIPRESRHTVPARDGVSVPPSMPLADGDRLGRIICGE